jgi:hypothetical protein
MWLRIEALSEYAGGAAAAHSFESVAKMSLIEVTPFRGLPQPDPPMD